MPRLLEPHPLAAIFPELPSEELNHLARDIKERGQIEPIILYKGLILDGRNRYNACHMAGVKPRFEEFNPRAAKRSPEEFILSRNLRRRHLSTGQKAAIALEWADHFELSPKSDKNKSTGRPRGAVLEAAKHIGIERQRVFEARQIRDASASLYKELKAGRRSLNSVLEEIKPQQETRSGELEKTTAQENGNGKREAQGRQTGAKGLVPVKPSPPSPAALEKALARIKAILGTWFHAEVKAMNLIQKPEEIVQFAKFTDAQMKEIGSLLKRGWVFAAAVREIVDRLTPNDEIRALHSRTIENGGTWCLVTIGEFGHVVVRGDRKEKILAKYKDLLTRPSS